MFARTVQRRLPENSLVAHVQRHGMWPAERVVGLGLALGRALAPHHERGTVYGSLAPETIFLTRESSGGDRITLAAPIDEPVRRSGLWHFVAPEQGLGEGMDARTDVYAVGAVLFFALTTREPFSGRNAAQVAAAHIGTPVPDPRRYAANTPRSLSRIVMRCMSKFAEDRFPNVTTLRGALMRVGRGRARPNVWFRGPGVRYRRS